MRFDNKTAIVTGAGQGIGLEIVRQLVAEGANVVLNDIDETLAIQSAQLFGHKVVGYGGDVSEVSFNRFIVNEAIKTFGSLDIVVANAGITLFGDFLNYSPEAFDRVMAVNLRGTFFLTQAAAQQMKNQGNGGSICLMSSVTGHQAHANLAAYGMSKAAIEMLAKNLVIELSPYKININTVAPGATMTERTAEDKGYFDTWSKITPLQRPASVQDIASAVLFMVSPQARHITGQSLVIDGGWTATSPSPY